MKNQPFFSIVTPTLNEEKFLPRLLQNLVDQTSQNFEVIHVDGQSEDKTRPLAQSFANKLPAFKQIIAQVRHVSHQRNLGAKAASGQYILFFDADTQLPNYFIEGLSYQLHKNPSDIFTSWSSPDSDRAADKAITTIVNMGLEIADSLDMPFAIGGFIGCTPKVFNKVRGFDEKMNFAEDEMYIKTAVAKGFKFTVFREPRWVYSLRRFRKEGTLSTIQNWAAKWLSEILNNKNIKAKYPMGGHLFSDDDPTKNLLTSLEQRFKKLTNNPKLKQFLRNLLDIQS